MDQDDQKISERNEYYRTIIARLTMMSDMFMRNVLKEQESAEEVLRIIIGDPSLTLVDVTVEEDYKNLQGRSAVLDCVAKDADGKLYNIEVQQNPDGASPERARYYAGLIDMNTLNVGKNFDQLPETYVIFITPEDVLGYNLPIYHIKRKIEENMEQFHDRSNIIYVNAQNQEDTELGRLMHDFQCRNASEMYNQVLAKRVSMLKDSPKGVEIMCAEMKKIEEYGRKQGIEQGQRQAAEKAAISMLEDGMPYDLVAKYNQLSLEEVERLDAKRVS